MCGVILPCQSLYVLLIVLVTVVVRLPFTRTLYTLRSTSCSLMSSLPRLGLVRSRMFFSLSFSEAFEFRTPVEVPDFFSGLAREKTYTGARLPSCSS
uniref:Putative metalloprotease n=1 Tax=Ixodes ricinus TaxID=34613 RepID=A0A0K8R572_IXORI